MANHVVVTINGKSYAGRPTLNALINVEKELGKPIPKIFSEMSGDNYNLETIMKIMRYCLHPINDTNVFLTVDQMDEIMNSCDLKEIMEAFGQITGMMFSPIDGGTGTKKSKRSKTDT